MTGGTDIHTHTHSDWDNVDMLIHQMFICLEYGRTLESLEKTHADVGRTCELHTMALAEN